MMPNTSQRAPATISTQIGFLDRISGGFHEEGTLGGGAGRGGVGLIPIGLLGMVVAELAVPY